MPVGGDRPGLLDAVELFPVAVVSGDSLCRVPRLLGGADQRLIAEVELAPLEGEERVTGDVDSTRRVVAPCGDGPAGEEEEEEEDGEAEVHVGSGRMMPRNPTGAAAALSRNGPH